METTASAQPVSHVYFRPTTADQRCLLFDTVEQLDNVAAAARRAHVGRGTYYYWQPRYEADGIAGLLTTRSRAPHRTRLTPISAELQAEVLDYHQSHPGTGCRSIANAIRQAHGYQKVIGHSKVHELIVAARPRPSAPAPASMPDAPAVVHAPQPNQTVNIDLCVVPVTHTDPTDWVSVSVSEATAGVVAETPPPAPTAEWPGQVFADSTLTYAEQMQTYGEQRTAKRLSQGQRKHLRRAKQAARAELNARSDELRLARRRQRLARRLEEAGWKDKRRAHQESERTWKTLAPQVRAAQRAERQTHQAQWEADQAARRAQREQCAVEDAAWRQERRTLREQLAQLAQQAPLVTTWLAILVVVCNGTRRCVGLPLFTAGVHVTAEMIVAALRALRPPELQFIISDNGAQFIAEAFAQFVKEQELLHVRIAPHRPRTNGIAERFVRTLKEWLACQTWNSPEELAALLIQFIEYYNERPHQGAELDGLSPNEFARRLRDCSRS
jgi:transposase InsO family protein